VNPFVEVERVETLDPMWFADCDFSFELSRPAGQRDAYPFDPAHESSRLAGDRMIAVLRVGRRMAGYIVCQLDGRGTAEVRRLEIDRRRRNQGLGRRLVREAKDWARECGLSGLRLATLGNNRAAGNFFGQRGFRLDGYKAGVFQWHLPFEA